MDATNVESKPAPPQSDSPMPIPSDPPEIGKPKPKMGVPKMGVPKMGVPKMGVPKMGVPKMGVPKMGVPNRLAQSMSL